VCRFTQGSKRVEEEWTALFKSCGVSHSVAKPAITASLSQQLRLVQNSLLSDLSPGDRNIPLVGRSGKRNSYCTRDDDGDSVDEQPSVQTRLRPCS